MAQSLASVAEPPLPKMMSFPPRCTRSRMATAARRSARLARALLARAAASSATFMLIELGHLLDESDGFLLFLAEKGIKKLRPRHIVAQLAMLEEDVHGLPKRVIEDLDHFLVNEGMLRNGLNE